MLMRALVIAVTVGAALAVIVVAVLAHVLAVAA